MNTLEEFFKNRISFKVEEYYDVTSLSLSLQFLADEFTYTILLKKSFASPNIRIPNILTNN